jgi:hypothetical protein
MSKTPDCLKYKFLVGIFSMSDQFNVGPKVEGAVRHFAERWWR